MIFQVGLLSLHTNNRLFTPMRKSVLLVGSNVCYFLIYLNYVVSLVSIDSYHELHDNRRTVKIIFQKKKRKENEDEVKYWIDREFIDDTSA